MQTGLEDQMNTTRNTTLVGVFHERSSAESAVRDLRSAGFDNAHISLVTKGHEKDLKADKDNTANVAAGAATGAVAGAGVAAMVSLGMTFGIIPVIGPVLALGPLAAALLTAASGAAAGGLVGGLVGLGIPEEEAKYYEKEVASGRTLVTVRTDGRYDEAWDVMNRHGAYNYETIFAATTK
jgi:hypothetical protein